MNKPGKKYNPVIDAIRAVCIVVHDERVKLELGANIYKPVRIVIVSKDTHEEITRGSQRPQQRHVGILVGMQERVEFKLALNEVDLIQKLIDVIHRYDPDIIMGYDMLNYSLGFIVKRCTLVYGIRFLDLISRVPLTTDKLDQVFYLMQAKQWALKEKDGFEDDKSKSYYNHRVRGRSLVDVYSRVKVELHIKYYDLDYVAFHLLQSREPVYSYDTLSQWYKQGYPHRLKVFEYVFHNIDITYKLMETLDLVNRDITMAKTYGIDFESVDSRGSQFKVEALLSRIARRCKYLLLSAPKIWVRNQDTQEVIPYVQDPERRLHWDPVAVLDFQSLYPSVIISHNICYTTWLGRIEKADNKFGVYKLNNNIKRLFGFGKDQNLTPSEEQYILDNIIVSPNNVAFVKRSVREGIFPRMLSEVLNTRIMIKKSMKMYDSKSLDYRILDSRQYALKMVANVTYGYTAAGHTGRMPCVEIADAIVSFSRLTLEHSIQYAESNECYENITNKFCQPKVIYGDTDSLFVKFPGCSVSQAYDFSQNLIKYITKINPYPMELKYEKVYSPLVNEAMKRYVGFKYEDPTDIPKIEAKGIEIIRRDFIPVVSEILQKVLSLLFNYNDLSLVKKYYQRQWLKIKRGDIEITDMFLKKEDKTKQFELPDKNEAIEEVNKQLYRSLNRIFNYLNIDVRDWCNELSIKEANIMSKHSINHLKYNQSKKQIQKIYFTSPYLLLSKELESLNNKAKSKFGVSK